ncbi:MULTISPECIES: hypothetical protein [Nocardia]|nr:MULTISPECIES: hypothetical protein [Nocardia]
MSEADTQGRQGADAQRSIAVILDAADACLVADPDTSLSRTAR